MGLLCVCVCVKNKIDFSEYFKILGVACKRVKICEY